MHYIHSMSTHINIYIFIYWRAFTSSCFPGDSRSDGRGVEGSLLSAMQRLAAGGICSFFVTPKTE